MRRIDPPFYQYIPSFLFHEDQAVYRLCVGCGDSGAHCHNVGVVAVVSRFLWQPIRLMGWALFRGIVGLVAFVIIEPPSVLSIIKEKARLLAFLCVIGGFTPYFFAQLILMISSRVTGSVIEP